MTRRAEALASRQCLPRSSVDRGLNMSDDKPVTDTDITKDWRATQGQSPLPSASEFLPRYRGLSPSAARSPGSSCSTGTRSTTEILRC